MAISEGLHLLDIVYINETKEGPHFVSHLLPIGVPLACTLNCYHKEAPVRHFGPLTGHIHSAEELWNVNVVG